MPITETRFRFEGCDGTALAGVQWRAAIEPKFILQLAHGAGEHMGRYRERFERLAAMGIVIFASDHRGHGMTSGMSHLGDFGIGGAAACVDDMASLSKLARDEYPGIPLVLMGHSMGAMFAQVYLAEHWAQIDALILSGTTGPGPRFPGNWNDAFPDARTDYDWLSRDSTEVDLYVADPFCGMRFSPGSLTSVLGLVEQANQGKGLERLRGLDLPIYVFVGEEDPVNNRLKGLLPLIERYRSLEFDVTFKVYPGGRHEMLNEINRDEVIDDLIFWIEGHLRGRRSEDRAEPIV